MGVGRAEGKGGTPELCYVDYAKSDMLVVKDGRIPKKMGDVSDYHRTERWREKEVLGSKACMIVMVMEKEWIKVKREAYDEKRL